MNIVELLRKYQRVTNDVRLAQATLEGHKHLVEVVLDDINRAIRDLHDKGQNVPDRMVLVIDGLTVAHVSTNLHEPRVGASIELLTITPHLEVSS